MITNILVTTDLSDCAAAAFLPAAGLQDLYLARVTIFSILDPKDPDSKPAVDKELKSLTNKYFQPQLTRVETLAADGDVASQIVDYSSRTNIDLIVISTHGRSGLSRMFLGSVTESIIGQAHCPVMVVHSHEPPRITNHQGFHIVVATDLSTASEGAMPLARDLFDQYGPNEARLTLLHLAEDMTQATFGQTFGVNHEAICLESESAAKVRLEELRTKYFDNSLTMTALTRTARPVHEELVTYAEAHDVDLVVLTKQIHAVTERFVLGSVVHNFIRHSNRRLMVTPAKLV